MIKRVPHTYVIVFYIILFAAALTWVLPGGSFDRETMVVNGVEREIIKAGSFHFTEQQPQTWQIFSAFFEGFRNTSEIIVFILMILLIMLSVISILSLPCRIFSVDRLIYWMENKAIKKTLLPRKY